jgi:uncharacterized protein YraI
MSVKSSVALAATCLVFAASAHAQTSAVAWTDLNLRAGPGPGFAVLEVIPAQAAVQVDGCLEAADWCRVTHGATQGWASGTYLTGDKGTTIVEDRTAYQVTTVTYDGQRDEAALVVGTVGAILGAAVGGPVGALAGGALGAGTGRAIAPDATVVTYVRSNPVEPVYLDGEVVVGAGLPDTVTLREIPESELSYTYVNGLPVIVERTDRRVVAIVR